jgi:hypothetical protein
VARPTRCSPGPAGSSPVLGRPVGRILAAAASAHARQSRPAGGASVVILAPWCAFRALAPACRLGPGRSERRIPVRPEPPVRNPSQASASAGLPKGMRRCVIGPSLKDHNVLRTFHSKGGREFPPHPATLARSGRMAQRARAAWPGAGCGWTVRQVALRQSPIPRHSRQDQTFGITQFFTRRTPGDEHGE